MSFQARSAEVPPGQQFARFPRLLGVWAERAAGFGIREGCLAVTVPGTNFTARRVLFLISFPVVETLFQVKSVRLCRRHASSQLMFAFEAYSHDQESGETRCYHLFPLLETSSIPVTNFLGKVCLLGPCAVLQGCDCAFHL